MTKRELLIHEIEKAPEPLVEEMWDFIHFLKEKKGLDRLETAIASETSLGKDWLKPEEDEAWQNL